MTIQHLSTRSLARASLLVSAVALAVALVRVWSAPHTSLSAALAAAPKTELRRTFHARDPGAARSYYLGKKPEDLTTYTHPAFGFSFPYLKDFTVDDLQDDQGELVLVSNPAVGMGLQIFLTPDEETAPLSAERIHRDLPDMPMDEVVEFTLSDDTAAVRFVSHDPVLGDVAETWFRKEGHLFQLSVSAPGRELQDAWVRDIAAHLTFPDNGPADASTQQQ